MSGDGTPRAGASGFAVVQAVIKSIEDSNFQKPVSLTWNQRMVATDSGTYRSGYHRGIWQVVMMKWDFKIPGGKVL